MRDEEYVYFQDLKEKKVTGYSARKQRSHCGKAGCKLPSDYLTKKEIKNMSGEVKSYRLNEPMMFDEFRSMPDDLQEAYLKAIREKYNASDTQIAKMMYTSQASLRQYLVKKGLNRSGRWSGKEVWDKEGFYAWAYGIPKAEEVAAEEEQPVEVPEEVIEDETPIIEEVPCEPVEKVPFVDIPESELKRDRSTARNYAYPISGSMNFEGMAQDIMALLDAVLFGKNIKMSVSWEVCND